MKNFIKVICASVLALASFTSVAGPVVPADASGYWESQQTFGLKVILASGKYSANGFGLSTCGKVLKATVSIPRTGPVSGWVFAEGQQYDPSNVGIQYGQTFNLLTKNALAGTFSVEAYDPVNNYLTIRLNTTGGGPSGTFRLNRNPLTPYTAIIAPNCP